MVARTLCLLSLLLLAGCRRPLPPPQVVHTVDVQKVEIPILIDRKPPTELVAPLIVALPTFVAPTDPLASSALTAVGERAFQGLIEELLSRLAAWQAWALAPAPSAEATH